jgi:hypothetical protein
VSEKVDPPLQTSYDFTDMLEGPGKTVQDDGAACKLVTCHHPPHFPHAMQQLYRSTLWWLAHPNKQSFLILEKKQPVGDPFLQGILSNLKSTTQVKVVRLRFGLKVLRGTQTYQWDDGKHSCLCFGAEFMPLFCLLQLLRNR